MSGKPIILYENVISGTGVSVSGSGGGVSELAGFPAVNAFSPFTYPADSWMIERGTSTGLIEIVLNDSVVSDPFDSIGFIVSGTAGDTMSLELRFEPTIGSPVVIDTITIDRDGCYFSQFTERTSSLGFYYIEISGIDPENSDSTPIIFPVIMIGKAMQFEKCIRNRYAPIDYNRKTEFLTNESGTGQYMGRSIIRRNHESTVSFDLMTAAWVRSTFQPFVRHARTKPYFFIWNPTTYPDEVNYVWTDEDIGVEYTGDRDRMSASWGMRGLGNDQE